MSALVRRLRRHLGTLAGEIGERNLFLPETLAAAAGYIQGEWSRQGYSVGRQTFEAQGVPCSNLEVNRAGRTRPGEILLLGAHYDSVAGSPGANDNASGVAALLELSRLFAAAQPEVTVRFVAFVNEEPPFFTTGEMGSMVYARRCRERREDIRLMVTLETIGYYTDELGSQRYPPLFRFFYPQRGNFVAFVSNLRSRRMLRRAVAAFRSASDFPLQHAATLGFIPGVGWSDHLAFWRHGYPALMVTDTAFYRYPYYHTPADTPERVDVAALSRLTEALFGAFGALAAASDW